ncbi:MAG TPA: PAS domain-containing protein [Gemmatimonadales bacterium]
MNEYYEAWSAADEHRILSYYADNVVIQIPGVLMEGREALRDQFVRPFIIAFPGNWHRVRNLMDGPGVATVEFTFEADHTGPFAGHAATGARVVVPACGVYEYDAAKRQITAARIYFDVGALLQTITAFPAVDRSKAAEPLQQLNERNLSLIVNTIPTTAWTTRPDGYCDFLNQRWLDYAGMTAEQASGWGWAEAIHPDDRTRLVDYWQSCLASGVPVETEGRMRRFDGSYRWFLFRANPVRDESGTIVKWYGTNIDIEDRKRGEEALRASELSWRQIVDHIPGLVCTWGPLGEVEFVNRQALEYFGRTREELQRWALIDAVHPDDLPRVIEARKRCLEAGKIYDSEHRCRRADGIYRWFHLRGLPVRDAGGTITAWCVLLTDIDDRKKAEEALQASEHNLSQTINTIPTFIAVTRPDGFILSVNQAALDYHGITLQDTQQEDFGSRWFHPDDMERLGEVLGESLRHPRPFECEYRALGKDGKYRWFLVRYNPLLDAQGRIERWYVTGSDIQDRKETEEALRQSGRQFRLLVETIPALVWRSTPEGDLDYLNKRAVEYLGQTAESLSGGRWLELVHPDQRETTLQRWLQSVSTGTAYQDEYRLRRADGQHRWIQSVGEPFLDTEGRIANWYGVVFDIDDRKRAEEAQARQASVRADVNAAFARPTHLAEILRGCLEAIVRHLDAAFARIWLLNKDESVLELQASEGMYTRLDGSYSRIPVGDLKVGWIAREKKPHFTNDVMNDPRVHDKGWARRNGMVAFAGYPLLVEDRLIGVAAMFSRSPLTESVLDTLALVADTLAQGIERKRAEEALTRSRSELAHMARVTTLSALTASIAHEVNQPIAAVTASASACLRWLNRDEPEIQRAREAAKRIEEDGHRAAEIVAHLKSFYKKDVSPQRELVSVNHLVDEMLVLLRSEAQRHAVVVRTELAADLPSVSGDRVQLQQVLMNLMLNGMEAMSEEGGDLTIGTRLQPGEVMVSVRDTGVGIPESQAEHIFSEFVTTKPGGTGMGLAISRTIVEAHGGRLWAAAKPERGATFHFTLPTEGVR